LTGVVVDASVALAWCFPDEGSDYADEVLVALDGIPILVPAVWSLEVANAILVGERNKRLHQREIQRFSTLLQNLSVDQDTQSVEETWPTFCPLRVNSASRPTMPPISSSRSATVRLSRLWIRNCARQRQEPESGSSRHNSNRLRCP
jgi:hypothetical protein